MEKEYYTQLTLVKDQQTRLVCPFCDIGKLECQPRTIHIKCGNDEDHLGVCDREYVFSGLLACNNNECKSFVSFGGRVNISEEYDNSPDGWSYYQYLSPKWFYPEINLFSIPEDCPSSVKNEILKSFSCFFCDEAASGMHIRIAIEKFLDANCIATNGTDKNGNYIDYKLHKRIGIFKETENELGQQLMALKYLGNEVSHGGDLKKEDVLDAYEVIENVLNELYKIRPEKERIKRKCSDIEKKFKPKKS